MHASRHLRGIDALLIVGLVWSWAGPVHGATIPGEAAIGREVTAFGFDLFRQAGHADQNLLISPYSLATALAMVRAGAQGRTLEQMDRALHLASLAGVDAGFGRLQESLQGAAKGEQAASGGTLRVANGLWAQQGSPILPAFRQTAEGPYRGRVAEADFAKDPEGVRRTINGWVAELTEDKIRDLIPQGGVGIATRLVLANALYFKNAWETQFDPNSTHEEDFFVQGRTKVRVPTMSLHHSFGYADTDTYQLLKMPYASGDAAMVIVLPKSRIGLAAVEKALTAEALAATALKATPQDVVVALPRFTIRSSFSLSDALKALGMADAFGPEADFAGMTTGKDLQLAEVYHQTYLAVTEQGTEAAAATAGRMDLTTAREDPNRPKPITFIADHPFLVFIRHAASGTVLFHGRVTDPSA